MQRFSNSVARTRRSLQSLKVKREVLLEVLLRHFSHGFPQLSETIEGGRVAARLQPQGLRPLVNLGNFLIRVFL